MPTPGATLEKQLRESMDVDNDDDPEILFTLEGDLEQPPYPGDRFDEVFASKFTFYLIISLLM